jgi:hypothetical protein
VFGPEKGDCPLAADGSRVRSLLFRTFNEGVVVIPQKELLFYLGWQQDRPNAWKELLDFWIDMGQQPGALHGFVVAGNVVLTLESEIERVKDWAELTEC